MFDLNLHRECSTLAECFVLSGKNEWYIEDFVKKMFTSTWGLNILKGISTNEYTCEAFMYEGLENELGYVKGKTYSRQVLWFAGYLYRYLVANSETPPKTIYKKVPISLLEKRYGFYHTQDWDYIMQDLNL